MIDRARESRNPKKVIRVTLMESYGEIGRVPVNLLVLCVLPQQFFIPIQPFLILAHIFYLLTRAPPQISPLPHTPEYSEPRRSGLRRWHWRHLPFSESPESLFLL